MTLDLRVAFGCTLGVVLLVNERLAADPQQQSIFRAEARAVEIDVFVTDSNGDFVADLTRNDFEITEDGEPQAIDTFSLINIPIETPLAGTREASRMLSASPDTTTNATSGRIYVMLLESPGLRVHPKAQVTRQEMFRYTQRIAGRFIDEVFGPNDLMAVVHAQGSRSDAQSFTSDKTALRQSIDRLTADLSSGVMPVDGEYCDRAAIRNSYETLERISEWLGAVTGRRKAILWVNGRVPFDPLGECQELGGAAAGALAFVHRDALRAATRNNVAIYPIDPIGLTADPEPSRLKLLREAALRSIADDTGGDAVINTNNFSPAFQRIVSSNSSYYFLAYRPSVEHRDGRFHEVSVRVRRRDCPFAHARAISHRTWRRRRMTRHLRPCLRLSWP